MNRIDIVVDGEKRLSFSGKIKDDTPGDFENSLAEILKEASSMLKAETIEDPETF